MLIIPAIDIVEGKCVRLFKGDFSKMKEYSANLLDVAKSFEKAGVSRIHIVDLEAAKKGEPVNADEILKIAREIGVEIEVGGGIRNFETAEYYLKNGIKKVVLGSAALTSPMLIKRLVESFGADRIVAALDLKNGGVMTDGWLKDSGISFGPFLNELKKTGLKELIFTDIEKDGTLEGPNFNLLKKLINRGFEVIVSGGVRDMRDVKEAALSGAKGVIIGTAFYEGKINLKKAVEFVKNGLRKRIIPCLDVKDGRVVKGVGFKNLRDSGDPVELAKFYSGSSADELIFLDISATNEGRKTMVEVVEKVAKEISIPFTVGGGIATIEQIRELLNAGADKISINSAAVKNPDLITKASKIFGSQCIVVAIDAKKNNKSWNVFINAGETDTGLDAIEWAKEMERRGAGEILLTSMDRDGTKDGYDIELIKMVSGALKIPVIASGGAGSIKDLAQAFVLGNADAVLAASIFHYNEISIPDARKYLVNMNV
jgi:phosphoribosylformimino-5-aminoimidazole carboxamide ribotide isomerase